MFFTLPKDSLGNPLQALAPSTNVSVPIGSTSLRATIPAGSEVVRVATNQKCFIKFGDSTVTATSADMVFPLGVEVLAVPFGVTHIAVIQDGAVFGAMSVTKML
jgi:hypothetical protein